MPQTTPQAAAACLALAALLAGCGAEEAPSVVTERVGRGDVTEVVEAPATVAAKASATVSAPAAGTVEALLVEEGQRVRAGDVLLRIDSPQAESALERATDADEEASRAGGRGYDPVRVEGSSSVDRAFASARSSVAAIRDAAAKKQALAAVEAAEAQYRATTSQARRAASSLNSSLGSVSETLGALSEAQRAQTQAAIRAAERTLAALEVRAPIAGTVSLSTSPGEGQDLSGALGNLPEAVRGQAGEALGAGAGAPRVEGVLAVGTPVSAGGPLLTVTDTSTLALTAEVDETDILLVKPGVAADVELDAVPGATYRARVTSIDVAPSSSGRGGVSYVVRLALAGGRTESGERAPRPRPGMSAVADLRVRTARQAVAVPVSAVSRDGRRDVVWVAEGGTARRRPVRLGAQGEDRVEVRQGLRAGETVVVRGGDRVSEGQTLP